MTEQQELDEILGRWIKGYINGSAGGFYVTNQTKQDILDWHNKQIKEVIKKPHILPKNAQHQESVKQGINFYHRQMRKRVDKLKERDDE